MPDTTFISSKPENWITPFPTIGEVIRVVANVLETKVQSSNETEEQTKKKLDRLARKEFFDYEEIDKLWTDVFNLPEELAFGKILEEINNVRGNLLETYIRIVREGISCGYSRKHIMECISRRIGRAIYCSLNRILEGNNDVLRKLIESKNPVSIAFKLTHKEKWDAFRKNPPFGKDIAAKNIKENVYRWMNGEQSQTPAIESLIDIIKIFCDYIKDDDINKEHIYKIFFCAKIINNVKKYDCIIDEFQNTYNSKILTKEEFYEPLEKTLFYSQSSKIMTPQNEERVKEYFILYERIKNELLYKQHKNEDAGKFDDLLKKLEKITNRLQDVNICWWNTQRLRAVWYVLSGKLEVAMRCYEEITDIIFYTGEPNSEKVFKEALVLASILKKRPFLKKLKHHGVVFGLFGLPYTDDSNQSYTNAYKEARTEKYFVVEDSEVKAWASQFYKYFPKISFFVSEDKLPESIEDPSLLGYIVGDMPLVADVKNKNKAIYLEDKKYPQLVWFTMERNIQAVKELLNAGVNVNDLSSSGDSALLLAIQEMNITNIPGPPPEERNIEFFEFISKYPHNKKTLETLTNKKHLSILGSAVETGRPGIVYKVLDMMKKENANIDIKYGGDKMTPLYRTICLFKAGERLLNPQREIPPETFEYMRRTGGLPGITTEDVAQNYYMNMINPIYAQSCAWTSQILSDLCKNAYKKENLLEIINALLSAGSNPNEPHELLEGMLKGYTPLMIAAELDLVDVFDLLIKNGGNVNQTFKFIHERTGELKEADCWQIVLNYRSNNVLKYMQTNCKGDDKIVLY